MQVILTLVLRSLHNINQIMQIRIIVFLSFIAILSISSCSDQEIDETLGVYHLKSIESDCDEIGFEYELIKDGNLFCIQRTWIDTTGGFTLTTVSLSCNRIVLQESGVGLIISKSDNEIDTNRITYLVTNDNVEICNTDNNCADFEFRGNDLTLPLNVTQISGANCNRTFVYQK